MRLNKIVVFAAMMLMLTPLLTVIGTNNTFEPVTTPNNYGDDVGVTAGMTIKYDINELAFPAIPNLTISDLAGNQLYVKVMSVEDKDFGSGVIGKWINYGMGLIFLTDETITIGEGFTSLDIIIPTGAATPAAIFSGVPHFNGTQPVSLFFLDDGWAFNEIALQTAGFDVTNGVDEFTASIGTDPNYMSLTYRKSDGFLTDLHIEDIYVLGMNFTDITIDISLASYETKGLDLTVGQEIELVADIAHLAVEGTGDAYSMLNQSMIESITDEVAGMEGQTLLKYVITDIEGLYYTADVYSYDLTTESLIKAADDYLFVGFLGGIQMDEPPLWDSGMIWTDIYAPAITPDYDIYAGYMVIFDTLVSVYLDDLLSFIPTETTTTGFGYALNTIDGTFGVEEKKGYFFLKELIEADVDVSIVLSLPSLEGLMLPEVDPTLDINAILHQEGWVAYAEDGILAGMRVKADIDVTITSEFATISGMPTGTVSVDFDFKVTNPDYNPPDPIKGGIFPGFTWLVSIPALFGIAAVGLIIRRRK
ncbi:MAG: hypothetical protein FK732_09120 [Asgard group archaeon]|nr:hypothetical protein [Asgard group archaeon]